MPTFDDDYRAKFNAEVISLVNVLFVTDTVCAWHYSLLTLVSLFDFDVTVGYRYETTTGYNNKDVCIRRPSSVHRIRFLVIIFSYINEYLVVCLLLLSILITQFLVLFYNNFVFCFLFCVNWQNNIFRIFCYTYSIIPPRYCNIHNA